MSTPITTVAAPVSSVRTQSGSSCARRSAMAAGTPALEQPDQKEGDQRHADEDHRDRGRLAAPALLCAGNDLDGGDFRPNRHVARDEDYRAVLVESPCEHE